MREPITINIKVDGETKQVTTYDGEYRSLMQLITDKFFVECFGDCGGMGRCATCIVEAQNSTNTLSVYERNEAATLQKNGMLHPSIRLSCQIKITPLLQNAKFKIVKQFN